MKIKDTLVISKEFGDVSGAREYEDGDYSGQDFYENHLLPRFQKAKDSGYILLIDIDGFWGWPSSFVSGSFGLLSKTFGAKTVLKHIQFKCNSNPMKIEKAIFIIKDEGRK